MGALAVHAAGAAACELCRLRFTSYCQAGPGMAVHAVLLLLACELRRLLHAQEASLTVPRPRAEAHHSRRNAGQAAQRRAHNDIPNHRLAFQGEAGGRAGRLPQQGAAMHTEGLEEKPEGYKKLLAQHEEVHAINAMAKLLAKGLAEALARPFASSARRFAFAFMACTSSCWASSFL